MHWEKGTDGFQKSSIYDIRHLPSAIYTSNTVFPKTIQIYSLTPKTCFAWFTLFGVQIKMFRREPIFFQIKETKGPSEESIWDSLKRVQI